MKSVGSPLTGIAGPCYFKKAPSHQMSKARCLDLIMFTALTITGRQRGSLPVRRVVPQSHRGLHLPPRNPKNRNMRTHPLVVLVVSGILGRAWGLWFCLCFLGTNLTKPDRLPIPAWHITYIEIYDVRSYMCAHEFG